MACSASSCADSFSTRTWPHRVGGSSSSSSALIGSPFFQELLALVGHHASRQLLAGQRLLELAQSFLPDDSHFLGFVILEAFGLEHFDFLRAFILGDAAAREHAAVDDGAFDARRHAQTGVAHLAGLFAENRTQQFLFGRKLGLALGRDLADQDVLRPDFGANTDDTARVEILQRFFANVGNVAGDFLGSELGVARDTLELLDMHRGEQVFLDHALGNQDRILEVVAAPRHERDQHVAAERQLTHVSGRSVSQHVAAPDALALDDD